MKKVIRIQQPLIHFRRWSRKGYAVFCSIGRCVSVRRLKKNVTEASLKKQKSASGVCSLPESTAGIDSDREGRMEPDLPERVSTWLSMLIYPQATNEVCFVFNESERKMAGEMQQCVFPAFFYVCTRKKCCELFY